MEFVSILNVGDIILGKHAVRLFQNVNPILQAGDVVVGQLEAPYTKRNQLSEKFERYPEYLTPLVGAGFDLLTLAGNHIMDAGEEGVEDTIHWLQMNNIQSVGAGSNIVEAKKPAILEKKGIRIGYLNYNCVGPKESWATSDKAGCSYLEIITHYELDHPTPGGPASIYTWCKPASLTMLQEDISELNECCDVTFVSLHKGLGHTPVKLADYEQEISYAAIDAGADAVIGHHAHILKGIEFYKNRPIFHGLGNFITYVKPSVLRAGNEPEAWAKRRKELFGFEPNPDYPTYPFHPEAIYTLICKCLIAKDGIKEIRCIPLIINKEGAPEVMNNDSSRQKVMDYLRKITEEAHLNAQFQWKDNEILVKEK